MWPAEMSTQLLIVLFHICIQIVFFSILIKKKNVDRKIIWVGHPCFTS